MSKIDYGSNQGREYDEYLPEMHIPLTGWLTLDEWLQRRMPSNGTGFMIASAIVFGVAVGVLLAHAWWRMA